MQYWRNKRRKSEASVERRKVSSTHFTHGPEGNTIPEVDRNQTIDPEISQYEERSTQAITTTDDTCDAGYLTPVHLTDTAGNITPRDSNATAGYITQMYSNDTKENYNYYVEIDT